MTGRLAHARYTLAPQAMTFAALHELTPNFTARDRTDAFYALPDQIQRVMWANLADHHDGLADEDWRIERDDERADPPRPAPRRSNGGRHRVATDDDLEAIPPATYVEVLLGVEVPHHGKIACPFHDDRTPSLHVYEAPEDGWFCFGCGRGGSIFDFAAELAGINPRGAEFVGLRDYLERRFT